MSSNLAIAPGSSINYQTGNWRTQSPVFRDKWAPCNQSCPASENIQGYLALASDQLWEQAWRKLTERNPLPATMGRICYYPCELSCNRQYLDSSVNIHSMERYIGDMAIAQGWQHNTINTKPFSQKIAVVGAGPAGLSCAYQLARRGYAVTLFDAAEQAGGMLHSAIPGNRLPKSVLSKEIQAILALGIETKFSSRIGENFSAEALQSNFDAVFLAVGAQQPRKYQDDPSTHSIENGIDFLRRINLGDLPKLPNLVAVIGGGNTALDAARCARRLGAQVTVVCAQSPRGSSPGHPGEEIPSPQNEILQAEAEGVKIRYGVAVKRLVRSGEHLSGVEIARVDQVNNSAGQFDPLLFEGTEEFLAAGHIIFAIGQTVNWSGLESLVQTNTPGVEIGGDAAGKSRFAATAVGSGYQAAMNIIAYLTGIPPVFEHHDKAETSFADLNPHYFNILARHEPAIAVSRDPIENFNENTAGLHASDALGEASRCLSCGACLHCDNCWHFCPDAAVIKQNGGYQIDYNYCKGCGICAQECPTAYIDMERLSH